MNVIKKQAIRMHAKEKSKYHAHAIQAAVLFGLHINES